jgi:hypothetical protein
MGPGNSNRYDRGPLVGARMGIRLIGGADTVWGPPPSSRLDQAGRSRRSSPLLSLLRHSGPGGAPMLGAPAKFDNRRQKGNRSAMKGAELRRTIEERERVHYVAIVEQFPWPVAAIRAQSPVATRSIEAAIRLSRRFHRVKCGWLELDFGWRLTPDEQGALLHHRGEREAVACVVQHARRALTGWYFCPEIPAQLREWLCPSELGLHRQRFGKLSRETRLSGW